MPLYKGSTDLIIVSGMSEYTLPSQLHAETMFGSQELKQPGTESDTELQPFFPESGPQTRRECNTAAFDEGGRALRQGM